MPTTPLLLPTQSAAASNGSRRVHAHDEFY